MVAAEENYWSLEEAVESIFDNGDLRVEHRNYYVSWRGDEIVLPRVEFLLFSRLIRGREGGVSMEELWQDAWGVDQPLSAQSVYTHLYKLRKRFRRYGIVIERTHKRRYQVRMINQRLKLLGR